MSSSSEIARLTGQDLAKWQALVARKWALEAHAEWYSREEAERFWLEYIRFRTEVYLRFGLDDTRDVQIAFSGAISYEA